MDWFNNVVAQYMLANWISLTKSIIFFARIYNSINNISTTTEKYEKPDYCKFNVCLFTLVYSHIFDKKY